MQILLTTISELAELEQNQKLLLEELANNTANKLPCPDCGSFHTIKNGSTHNGKSKSKCKDCGRQFVINPNNKSISLNTKLLIDKLLLERISLRNIVGITGVSFAWLQNYASNKPSRPSRNPEHVNASGKNKKRQINRPRGVRS